MRACERWAQVLRYVDGAELKRDLNRVFCERHPGIELTLSKLRSLKADMVEIGVGVLELEPEVVAAAHVYFEQVVLAEGV